MVSAKGKKVGGATTCKQDYFEVQYGKKWNTEPVITEKNTLYKFFLIDLYLLDLDKQNLDKQNLDQELVTLNVVYAVQDCINNFIASNGNDVKCKDSFKASVNLYADPKIQTQNDKIMLLNKKLVLEERNIYTVTTISFGGFVEDFSKSLDFYINNKINKPDLLEKLRVALVENGNQSTSPPGYNWSIEELIAGGAIYDTNNWGIYKAIASLLPKDHVQHFVNKLINDAKLSK